MESQNERILQRLIELEVYSNIENHGEILLQIKNKTFSNHELNYAIEQFERKIISSRKNQVVY